MIGRTNVGGGGSILGLAIVGGTTRPTKATQNTIWVDTDAEITGYVLSATEPENPVDGMVWITIGKSGSVKMSAPVGGEWITVCPLAAKQYVGGVWVTKTAKSYQNGNWVDWVVYLYNSGKQFELTTGGWALNGYTHPSITLQSGTHAGAKMVFSGISGKYQILGTENTISLSGKNQIRVIGEVTSVYSANGSVFGLVLSVLTTKSFSNFVAELAMNKVGKFDYTLDVSGLDGDYYIVIRAEAAPGCDGYVTEVYVE